MDLDSPALRAHREHRAARALRLRSASMASTGGATITLPFEPMTVAFKDLRYRCVWPWPLLWLWRARACVCVCVRMCVLGGYTLLFSLRCVACLQRSHPSRRPNSAKAAPVWDQRLRTARHAVCLDGCQRRREVDTYGRGVRSQDGRHDERRDPGERPPKGGSVVRTCHGVRCLLLITVHTPLP